MREDRATQQLVRCAHGQLGGGKMTTDIVHLRGGAVALVIGNDLAALLLPNADARVCGAEVNAHCRSVYLLVRHRVRNCLRKQEDVLLLKGLVGTRFLY